MSLVIIEGPRSSGKTHLLNKCGVDYFKLEFVPWYEKLEMPRDGENTHYFCLGKEVMLHQLYRDGYLESPMISDRGLFTTLVWGILENRISIEEAYKELDVFNSLGFFKNTAWMFINSISPNARDDKDLFDTYEISNKKELDLFNHFFEYAEKKYEINVNRFTNMYNEDSENNFIKDLNNVWNTISKRRTI